MTSAVQVRLAASRSAVPKTERPACRGDGSTTGHQPARFNGVGFEAAVEQFQAPPLLARGKANIIALDAISERFGGRWGARQKLVHDHAQKALRRELAPNAAIQRIKDTECLVVQPDDTRLAGQAPCLCGLRQILHDVQGEAAVANIKVHSVTRITKDAAFGQPSTSPAPNVGMSPPFSSPP